MIELSRRSFLSLAGAAVASAAVPDVLNPDAVTFGQFPTRLPFVPCDGRELLRKDYAALFSVIGNSYGGDENVFRLPDLRGLASEPEIGVKYIMAKHVLCTEPIGIDWGDGVSVHYPVGYILTVFSEENMA